MWLPHISLFGLDKNNLPNIITFNHEISKTIYKDLKFIFDDSNLENIIVE